MGSICIYCRKEEQLTREHYLPACLGNFKNYEPLSEIICSECNNKLSILEEQFCRCGPEAFVRIFLNIGGRQYHNKPSSFYRGSAGGKRIEIKAKHPQMQSDIYWELKPGSLKSKPARQLIVQNQNGEIVPILISDNIKTSKDLKKEFELKDIKKFNLIEFWAKQDEMDLIKNLLSEFSINPTFSDRNPYQDQNDIENVATIQVTIRYFQALAKIAFHYFLKHFPQFSGLEQEFDEIKKFIIEGGDDKNWIKQEKGSFIHDLQQGTTSNYCHFIASEIFYDNVIAYLQFFVGPEISPQFFYKVNIGKKPGTIIYKEGKGHQFVYYDKHDKDGFIGRMDALKRFSRELLP